MRVVQKEEKMVNSVDQWCIFLFLGGFEGMELHALDKKANFVTEVSYIEFLPINNPSIINTNKPEAPLEG